MRVFRSAMTLLVTASGLMFTLTVRAATQGTSPPPPSAGQPPAAQPSPATPPMTLSTTAFADGAQIPAKYTQAGTQTSPALTWTAPPTAVSFVLHMHDLEVARNR